MRKSVLLVVAVLSVTGFFSRSAYATHAMGGELNYKWISGNTYEFTYTFYRDCMGIAAPIDVQVVLNSLSCGVDSQAYVIPLVDYGEIPTVCSGLQTVCNGGTYTGYERYIYQGQVTLPGTCSDWYIYVSVSARNDAITNLENPGSYDLLVSVDLDNLNTPFNNAPVFTNAPVANLFVNQTYHVNNGAVDPDGDSLVFSLSNAMSLSGPLTYVFPYSATDPMSSSTPITLDPVSGDFVVTPNAIQVAVVTFLVEEYRNGSLVGSSIRDIQLIVKTGADQLPVLSGIDNTTSFQTSVIADSTLTFTLYSDDADAGQAVHITTNATVGSVTIDSSGTFPNATFSWTPGVADVRPYPYIITFTVTDDACPYVGIQTFSYLIYVTQSYTGDVWPGDADGDYEVTLYDILPIGIAFGETGPARPSASLSWTAQFCTDWSNSLASGVNYKHSDCDGNGSVENADFDAVTLNYGQFHLKPVKNMNTREGAPLFLDFASATIDGGSAVAVPIHLGSLQTLNGIYGIVFQLQFDPSLVQPGTVSFDANASWLGTNQDLKAVTIDESVDGAYNIGLVRLNQAEADGSGQIGMLYFTTYNPLNASWLHFDFANVKMIDLAQTELLVEPQEDSVQVMPATGIDAPVTSENVSLFPNPSNGWVTLQWTNEQAGTSLLQILNPIGQIVFEQPVSNGSNENTLDFDLSALPAGFYFYRIVSESATASGKFQVVR